MSSAASKRSVRLNLIALAAVALLPFVGAWLLYLTWRPDSFVNYGDLVSAVPLEQAGTGDPLRPMRGKWLMIMADSGECGEWCRRKLYLMRQLRLTQGKNMERIERVWLVDDGIAPVAALAEEYGGTHQVQAPASPLLRMLPAPASVRDHIYIVDPLGNVILRYPRDPDPSKMKKDLARLLRASRIG